MPEKTQDALRAHEYDGIQEYDNPTPGWWWLIFFLTFLFAVFYFVFFQFSMDAWTVEEAFEEAVAEDLRAQFSEIGELTGDEETILRFMHEEKWLTVGKMVFKAQCISCHAADGQGQVGPNMTDDYFKNVKMLADVATVVSDGAANGAMPAWKTRLHPNEIVLVSSYAASLRGQNLPGKQPEGDIIPPWPAYEAPPAESVTEAGAESS